MTSSLILLVDSDPAVATALQRDVARRYGGAHAVARAGDGVSGLERCRSLAEGGRAVSLLVAAQHLPDRRGTAFLQEAHGLHPDAGRILLTSHGDAETAVRAVNEVGLDRCLRTPWRDPSTDLYPVLDELLAGWAARADVAATLVRDAMRTDRLDVAGVSQGLTLGEAAARLAASGGDELMLVDAQQALVGTLAPAEVLRRGLPELEEVRSVGGTLHDAYQLFLRHARQLAGQPISQLMSAEPFVVHPDDHVAKAAALLVDHHSRVLPVVEDGRLVGTLSGADLCRAVLEPARAALEPA